MKPRDHGLTLKPRVESLAASSIPRFQSRYPRPECSGRLEPVGSFPPSNAPRVSRRTAVWRRVSGGVHRGGCASAATKICRISVVVGRRLAGYSDDDYAGTSGAFWALHVAKAIIAQKFWGHGHATVTRHREVIANDGRPTRNSKRFFRIRKPDTNVVLQRRNVGKSAGL